MNMAISRFWTNAFTALGIITLAGCGAGSQVVPTEGENSIYDAAYRGELSYVAAFLNGGFDVNTPDKNGRTLLHHAAAGNQLYMLETLMEEFRAKGSITDNNGKTPVELARDEQAMDAVWYLEEDQGL